MMFQDPVALRQRRNRDERAGLLVLVVARRWFAFNEPAGEAHRAQYPIELPVRHFGCCHDSPPGRRRARSLRSRQSATARLVTGCRLGTRTRTVFAPFMGSRALPELKYS